MRTRCFSIPCAVAGATLCALIFLFTFLETREVKGNSMEPTLLAGELIYINKAAYGLRLSESREYLLVWAYPKPGDLVVFRNPDDNELVVKRCLGIDGDRISIEGNTLHVGENSLPVDIFQKVFLSGYGSVPPGTLFAAGDSSANSVDSRDYGFIRIENIVGKVILYSGKQGTGISGRGRARVGFIAGDDRK